MFPARKPPSVTAEEIHRRVQKMFQPQPVKPKKVCQAWTTVELPWTYGALQKRCEREAGHKGPHHVAVEWDK